MMIINTIANELAVKPAQVEAAVKLLDEGSTVPFIARYRKEVTQGLDDTQLRNLEQRLGYLRELEDRRQVILKSISEQENSRLNYSNKFLLPIIRPRWKTYICPINRVVVPRGKLRLKLA